MNKLLSSGTVVMSVLIAACSTPVDLDTSPSQSRSTQSDSFFSNDGQRCDADPAQSLLGKTVTDKVRKQAAKLSGAKTVRVLRPSQVITMEYDPERVNLRVDESDVIATIGCG